MAWVKELTVAPSATGYLSLEGLSDKVVLQVYKSSKSGTIAYFVQGTVTNPSASGQSIIALATAVTPPTEFDAYPYLKLVNGGTGTLLMTVTEQI